MNPPRKQPAAIVVGAPSSGAGKTTVTCGLIAAFAARGLAVKCFKTGPDFLDGMQHRAALDAGKRIHAAKNERSEMHLTPRSRTVNLDGWMQGSPEAVRSTFLRHAYSDGAEGAPDICIIEGVMGLHDGRDGATDDGSSAQVAKVLGAPVLLVVDASRCARSVAATALGHAMFDPEVRVGGVVANLVSGDKDGAHVAWIRESLETNSHLRDQVTGDKIKFFGGLPRDGECAIPERHLGLHMPEETEKAKIETHARFERLARLMEENLDLDAIFNLGRTCEVLPSPSTPLAKPAPLAKRCKCRIGIAEDAAFCFYYADNLHLLSEAGAELVYFSPLADGGLPPDVDGLYFGGGYPELYASALQANVEMRRQVKNFCEIGGAVFAECGGFMYLAESMFVLEEVPKMYEMCGVFPGLVTRMTKRCTMHYASIEVTNHNPVFGSGVEKVMCRGQEFHYSEVVRNKGDDEKVITSSEETPPVIITPERPGAIPVPGGYAHKNTFASYLHIFFASKCTKKESCTESSTLADDFVCAATLNSPRSQTKRATCVSFVSAATEIVFALGIESSLAGVTSVCDYPTQAQCSPRKIICCSTIDASTMSSEEVTAAVEQLKQTREQALLKGEHGPPGNWIIDTEALRDISPNVVFVQNTCAICDAASDDVHHALMKAGLLECCKIVSISPTTIDEMFESIRDVGSSLNADYEASELIAQLKGRLQLLKEKIATLKSRRSPRVISLEGLAPLCNGGGWLPDIKQRAGCRDAFGDLPGCKPQIRSWREIQERDPDILLISPCSASPKRTMNELHLLASAPEFWSLRCVQQGNVFVCDHSTFSRPGPRLVDGCEMLASLFRRVPFDAEKTKQWEGLAFKYECSVNASNMAARHCTTELAQRFQPCFSTSSSQVHEEGGGDLSESIIAGRGLIPCPVTRCTIPGSSLPQNRSAHTLLSVPGNALRPNESLLLFGGEADDGTRLSDVWILHAS